MNASEAYKQTKKAWSEKDYDIEMQSIILGWEDKVNESATKGEMYCTVGVFKNELVSPVCDFFTSLGYSVNPTQVSITEGSVTISWANVPAVARGYIENHSNTQ